MENKYSYATTLTLAAVLAFNFATEAAGSAFSFYAPGTAVVQQTNKDAKRTEKELLGPYHETTALTADNLGHAYIIFLENVKARQSNWTENDWNNAQAVINQLNNKYNTIYLLLSVSDKARIKALQTEFKKLQEKGIAKKQAQTH